VTYELTDHRGNVFASNRPIDGIDRDGLEWQPYQFAFNILYDMFVGPLDRFKGAAKEHMEGSVQQASASAGQASYQNSNGQVPARVQKILAQKDKIEGTTKQITGGTKMFVATAETVATYSPLLSEAALAEGTAVKAPTAGKFMTKSLTEVPKPISFANWGEEFIDNGIRTTGQAIKAAAKEVNLTNRFTHIFGKAEHSLQSLVTKFGSMEDAYNAVQKAANDALKQVI